VTVLFADVVHSMDIAAAVGPERLREMMAELVECCAAVVQRYGGMVDKFTRDGIMAVFGAPVAMEDHAVRACLAALGIQVDGRHGTINQRVDRGNALGCWVATSCDAGAPVHHGTILSPLGIRRLRVAYLIFCASRLPQPVRHPRNPERVCRRRDPPRARLPNDDLRRDRPHRQLRTLSRASGSEAAWTQIRAHAGQLLRRVDARQHPSRLRRSFASSDSAFPRVSTISVAGSIPGSSTEKGRSSAALYPWAASHLASGRE
jgi:hypothetical protein